MSKKFYVSISISRSGVPCLWEGGGGATNTGEAQIIAGRDGQPKKPIYVKRRGDLSCGEHAMIPVAVGDLVIHADHHRQDFHIWVWQLTAISGEEATANLLHEFSEGEWSSPPPQTLAAAMEAAQEKATCYHCREPHFTVTTKEC